jgi:hypothetical protein
MINGFNPEDPGGGHGGALMAGGIAIVSKF